ncbi:MAG: hypothetical protein WA877_05775 [Legionella sp.]
MDCLIFEWLNYGFKSQDIEKILGLYALYELDGNPLQAGKYAFLLMTISPVFFACMAFVFLNLSSSLFTTVLIPNETTVSQSAMTPEV